MNRPSFETAVALLCVGVAAYAVVAYALLPLGTVLHPELRASFASHRAAVVYLHVFCAALALLLAPLQWRTGWRRQRPRLHRWAGRLYLTIGVGAGGLSGLALAAQAHGGAAARSGFGLLALLWLATGAIAWVRIRQGDVAAHQRWMVRNLALTLAAVTLRLMLPAAIAGGLALAVAYPLVAWLCWVPNLLAAEWLLRRRGAAAQLAQTAARAPASSHFSTTAHSSGSCTGLAMKSSMPASVQRSRSSS